MAETIIIDALTREITVPESERAFGVAGEHNVTRKHFRINGRIVDGNDIAVGFAWKVCTENASKRPNEYHIDSIIADSEGIEFDWLVGKGALAYKGSLKFAVCAKQVNSDGKVQHEWHSRIGTGTVYDGIEASAEDIGGFDLRAYIQQTAAEVRRAVQDAANSAAASSSSANAAKQSAQDADKRATDAENAANRISDSMTQIGANTVAVNQLKEDKLDKPNNPVVGQFLRVKSISDTGEIVLETMAGGVGSGLPNGGTVGQVLAKKSDADGDAEWADMESEEVTADNITQALGYTPRKAWYVNVTPGNPITADKTAAEIWKAYQDGYSVFAKIVVDGLYPFTLPLVLPMGAETFGFAAVGQLSEDSTPMTVCLACNTDEWRFFTCELHH